MDPYDQESYAIPPKVRAATDYVNSTRCYMEGEEYLMEAGDTPKVSRELPKDEKPVRRAAIEVLRNYFNGETDYTHKPFESPEASNKAEDGEAPIPAKV